MRLGRFTKVIDAGGESGVLSSALTNRGLVEGRRGNWQRAIDDYLEALRLQPKLASAHNNLAWLLATCPVDALRNGQEAVEHATLCLRGHRLVEAELRGNAGCGLRGSWRFPAGRAACSSECLQIPHTDKSMARLQLRTDFGSMSRACRAGSRRTEPEGKTPRFCRVLSGALLAQVSFSSFSAFLRKIFCCTSAGRSSESSSLNCGTG